MARLLWLAEVLRAAGLTVHEYDGWKTRGLESFGPVLGVIAHGTGGSLTSSDAGETRTIAITGSNTASAPIAQLYVSRTGAWWVLASGTCTGVKTGTGGPLKGYGDDAVLQVEAQHHPTEPWTEVQYRSYVVGVAALVRKLGCGVSMVVGHGEHQPGEKTDPWFDMNQFRADVGAVTGSPTRGGSAMLLIKTRDDATVYISHAGAYRPMTSEAAFNAAVSAGHRVVTVGTMAELEDLAGRPVSEPLPAPPVDVSALAAALAPLLPTATDVAQAVLSVKAELAKAVTDEIGS